MLDVISDIILVVVIVVAVVVMAMAFLSFLADLADEYGWKAGQYVLMVVVFAALVGLAYFFR